MPADLAARIRTDVERLTGPGDRDLGTERNRDATRYLCERMERIGLATESLPFDVPEWRAGDATVTVGGRSVELRPGPFSPPARTHGPLVVIRRAEDIPVTAAGAILLLCDEIAAEQFTPRGYPFYANPGHTAILDALEATGCAAVIAATTSSAMTGAMSPFPLIEDTTFAVPSAYLTAEEGAHLVEHAGEVAVVVIESRTLPSSGEQPIGRRLGSGQERVIVSAHVDSKPGTPGAIDNAAGVATMLAVAELAIGAAPELTLEFVPFNGEDHVLAPGEMTWLAANPDLSDVRLVVNIDAPGLIGGPSAYSLYGVDDRIGELAARLAAELPGVAEGPQWPASDHMVFAMRGIPSVAVTSSDFETASRGYSHTAADTPDILDYALLADAARFIAALIGRI